MAPRLVEVALGIWLMAAPAVLGLEGAARDNAHVVGPLVAAFSLVALWPVVRGLRRATLLLGAWLAVSPVIVGGGAAGAANAVAVGLALAVLSTMGGEVEGRFGGGWSALRRGR